ncbi:porin [Brucella abortus]|uniref:porin n=1 Tax=Brucella abortus TaxID=235 RepID=UPI00024DB089|nr:porin [Brucella abortus]EHR13136.1 porin omp2a [Brucella abortus bv. 1 str. NI435a]
MNIKSLLLGSAAALVAASGAQAADAIVAPEPEAVEYVRVCDAYGAGYFYIPGTETCLRVHGYVRYDVKGGDDVYSGTDRNGWDKSARFALRVSTGSETELGTLGTYTQLRFNYTSNNSRHDGQYGDFSDDRDVADGGVSTGKIAYTFTGGNGFSAVIALEQGGEDVDNDYTIDGYMPHVVGGLKYAGGWGSIAGVVAYDSVIEEWATKVRGDVNITDRFSVWLQGAYSSAATPNQNYGQWGGDWAVWGGAKFIAPEKATFNLQAAHDDWGKTAVTANVAYQLVPGFTITPEVSYTKFGGEWKDTVAEDNAWGGIVRFQRSF